MKRLTAILTAALIAFSVSTTAFAVPDDENSTEQTSNVSEQQENSKKTEESSKKSDDNSKKESSENKQESSEENTSAPEKLTYDEYEIKNLGMHIKLPSDTYVLTPNISADDPALAATKLTKKEVQESFSENDTVIKAFAKDFSYDITITAVENDKTNAIDNLTTLADKELDNVIEGLLQSEYTTGCAKNTYNDVLFLTLDMVYKSGDAQIYGIQEYTIVNGTNVIITYQSHADKLTDNDKALVSKIMSDVTFDGVEEPPVVSDVAATNVDQLDIRYILILVSSLLAIIALAAMIIVGTKYRQSHREESDDEVHNIGDGDKFIIKTPKTSIVIDDDTNNPPEKLKTEDEPYDKSIFTPSDENVIYRNEKLAEEKKKREETRTIPRLDSTTELSIPKNPYTPVGKAEAVAQPAMSVTSEIAKLSTISAEAAKAAEAAKEEQDKKETENTDGVVFAESVPKPKTEIQQIGEAVFDSAPLTIEPKGTPEPDLTVKPVKVENPTEKVTLAKEEKHDERKTLIKEEKPSVNKPAIAEEKTAEELSEYEKRFGKNRQNPPTANAAEAMQAEEEDNSVSKFEKHFGKIQPAATPKAAKNDTISAVDSIIKQEEKSKKEKPAEPSPITITKAPPKTEEPKTELPPVVKITKTTPTAEVPTKEVKPEPKPEEPKKPEKKAEPKKTPENLEEPTKSSKTPKVQKPEEKPEPVPEKSGLFKKIADKLFETDEEDDFKPVDTGRESTNKFISSLRDKLKYHEPEFEEEPEKPAEKEETDDNSVELYRSPNAKKHQQIELAVKKGKDGNIIIDSISDENGKPVQIEVKDKSEEKPQEKNSSVSDERFDYDKFFEKDKKPEENTDERFGYDKFFPEEKKEEPKPAVKDEKTPDKTESKPETAKSSGGRKKKKKNKKNKNNAASAVVTAAADTIGAAATTAAAVSAGKAAETAAAVGAAGTVIKAVTPTETKTVTVKSETKPEVSKPVTKKAEPKPEETKPVTEKVVSKQEVSKPVEDKAETKVEKPETRLEAEKAETKTEEVKPEKPKAPEFVFERDTGIIFERAVTGPQSYKGNITPLTAIPRLESVNANDYNKKIEEMRSTTKGPIVAPQTETAAEPDHKTEDKIEFYNGYDSDDTLDPFAPGSGEMTLKEIDKKTSPKLGERLKRSFGKIFSGTDDEN